jgi:Helix-turn-helix domain
MEMNARIVPAKYGRQIARLLNISELSPVSFHCMEVKIKKAFKFRLQLTQEQNERFRQFAGASRFAYNYVNPSVGWRAITRIPCYSTPPCRIVTI